VIKSLLNFCYTNVVLKFRIVYVLLSEILGSGGGDNEDDSLLECSVMQSHSSRPTF
jgi:hypothetical protein